MAQLSWITSPGTVANFLIGGPSSVNIQAVDTSNYSAEITYKLISGELPGGLSFDSTGTISGTPIYSNPENNYFTSETFNFTVRATTLDLRVIDGSFSIIISNTIDKDFIWVTPAGSLGTIPDGNFYQLQLQAQSTNNLGITYSFISGALPNGMQLVSTQSTKKIATTNQFLTANITLSSLQSINVGDYVFGTSIVPGTIAQAVDTNSNRVTLSNIPLAILLADSDINFYSPAYLQGVPVLLNTITVNNSEKFRFTIRATNSAGHINDRSFSLSVTNVYGPIIEPTKTLLGSYFDGSYFNQQLTVIELNPNVSITWSNVGSLPPGITLNSSGVLSGYIQPIPPVDQTEYPGYDYEKDDPVTGAILYQQEYDKNAFDFTSTTSRSLSYSFTVQAFDGANYDVQDYTIAVVSRPGFTADNSNITVDNTYLTTDNGNVYIPVILNSTTTLPTARQNSFYAFKFDGYDFAGDTITYSITNVSGTFDADLFDPLPPDDGSNFTNRLLGSFDHAGSTGSNLPGVILDAQSGWLHGKVNPQTSALKNYSFGITVSKIVNSIQIDSKSILFTLPVLGDVNNLIQWVTPINLGSIDNGSVSELSIVAKSRLNKTVLYELYNNAGLSAKLPQGLSLLSTGEISGRVSFEAFTIDDYTTTFDNTKTSIDRISTFTVRAYTEDNTAETYQEFTLKLNIINKKPYVNLYLRAMPAFDQRQIYTSVVNNHDIFDPNLIYRLNDPWFGVHQDLQMLFLPGLTSKQLNDYEQAIALNHWTKKFNFGGIKTAVVFDESYNKKYEVVYIDILDPEETTDSTGKTVGPGLELDLTTVIQNPYVDETGNEYKIVYPNSSVDMIKRLEQNIGYADQSSLPPWMTSNQMASAGSAAAFNPPLGFTKAVVLAYTIPGASKLIAYRLKTAGINFSNIDFTVDRYEIDNYYSTYFDTINQSYHNDIETTFDSLPTKNVGNIVTRVNYAVTIPYTEIHGRSIDYINARGGIDGVPITTNTVGQTLIFAKQEGFLNVGPYNGWINYQDSYIGDNINTPVVEGYDSESYDTYTVIPGFLEKQQGLAETNQRGSVWQVGLSNNIIILTPVKEIGLYDRVQISGGKTYGSAVMYYSSPTIAGQTVPYYAVYVVSKNAITPPTTFNAGTTKFFSNRDHYYVPNSQDKYLKFPQTGVFN